MRFHPYEYQRKGVEWLLSHPRCALFWEMGLGKSVVTLTAVMEMLDSCMASRALIVAPKKVAETTWTTEAHKWDHLSSLRVAKAIGTEKERRAALMSDAEVVVTGRDNIVWMLGECDGRLPFDILVLDELTSFKNNGSLRFKAVRKASAGMRRVIGLTGTPAPNGLHDLWAQAYCLDLGERLGKSVTRFREQYFDQHRWNNIVVRMTPKKGTEQALREKLGDICLTMQAADYLELPPMMEHTEYVDMGEKAAKGYREFERERVMEFKAEHGDDTETVTAASAAALMNKLSQYANGAVYGEDGDYHIVHDEKLERLAELIESAGESVLVFYQYRHDAERIMRRLGAKMVVREYEGEADLRDWNAGDIDVLLAHPASTAYGLNMQAGGHYIAWFGVGWNLELYQQANARLHRQGQKCPVTVYRLACRGTVDERMLLAMEGKQTQQQALMDGLKALLRKHGAA